MLTRRSSIGCSTSPRYGEHMARFWLDAARYGDTHGLHLDNYREMWPYRDWVINAFNATCPSIASSIEQLAGDLLPNPTLDQTIATGFNRCHVTTSEGGSISEEVYVRNVVDRVETTGTVFLGLTVGCARCHDHKFDPIRTKDYYQLFAFFNSLDENPLDLNAARVPPVISLATPEQTADMERSRRVVAALQKVVADEVALVKYVDPGADKPAAESFAAWLKRRNQALVSSPKPVQDALKVDATKRNAKQKQALHDYYIAPRFRQDAGAIRSAAAEHDGAEKQRDAIEKDADDARLEGTSESAAGLHPQARRVRSARHQVGRGTPAFLPPLPEGAPRNRLGLAQWLMSPDHPLTARVEVNRLWQQVFGTGLVKTAEDFGSQGEPPSHPELLDWLAVQFLEDGWDMKTDDEASRHVGDVSTVGEGDARSTGEGSGESAAVARSSLPARRRDAARSGPGVSGLLVEKVGGPSVKPPQPAGLWEAVGYTGSNTAKFVADIGHEKVHRRSMYTFWKRTSPPPQMTTFDAPSRESCTVRRERTNTPLQALLLLNEPQYVEASRAFAERAMKEGGTKPEERLTLPVPALATARSTECARDGCVAGRRTRRIWRRTRRTWRRQRNSSRWARARAGCEAESQRTGGVDDDCESAAESG